MLLLYAVVIAVPADEIGDTFFHRRARFIACRGNQCAHICEGIWHIAWLHRHHVLFGFDAQVISRGRSSGSGGKGFQAIARDFTVAIGETVTTGDAVSFLEGEIRRGFSIKYGQNAIFQDNAGTSPQLPVLMYFGRGT